MVWINFWKLLLLSHSLILKGGFQNALGQINYCNKDKNSRQKLLFTWNFEHSTKIIIKYLVGSKTLFYFSIRIPYLNVFLGKSSKHVGVRILKVKLSTSKKVGFIYFCESPLKMKNNTFYLISKSIFVLKVLIFLFWLFAYVGKLLDKKAKGIFRNYDVTNRNASNNHITRYLKK